MDDSHYPTIDYSFLKSLLESSDKIQKSFTVGTTTAYLFKGNSSISKRTVILRASNDNKVDFNFAVAIAHKAKRMGDLLLWLETERSWKDGGYTDGRKYEN